MTGYELNHDEDEFSCVQSFVIFCSFCSLNFTFSTSQVLYSLPCKFYDLIPTDVWSQELENTVPCRLQVDIVKKSRFLW